MFRALPCSSSGGLRRNCKIKQLIPTYINIRINGNSNFRQLTFYRVTIPEVAYIQLLRRPPEDEQGNARNM
jgi:hypothetical protein